MAIKGKAAANRFKKVTIQIVIEDSDRANLIEKLKTETREQTGTRALIKAASFYVQHKRVMEMEIERLRAIELEATKLSMMLLKRQFLERKTDEIGAAIKSLSKRKAESQEQLDDILNDIPGDTLDDTDIFASKSNRGLGKLITELNQEIE
jgi:chromatin segregation and condensation protein Rec8/ScpA/Scc1 (kleisin family)